MRWLWSALLLFACAQASAQPTIGVVVMHGKGGLPDGLVHELALDLERRGFAVANLEMPWSSRRDYDVEVAAGEKQVEAALADLRKRGAQKLFIAGHSQGGTFAFYLGGRLAVDGIVAIAPGGNVANPAFRERVAESVDRARTLLAEGKGAERRRFLDYEGMRGVQPVITTAAAYLTWFDPDGAMNQLASIRRVKAPVLLIVPTRDYPALLKAKPRVYGALPANPRTKLYEPETNHQRAPTDSRDEIARWMAEVAAR